ncbi:MAG: phage holin family protein [Oscillospiraceae bacterium]|nr:phage holin family protein [Oscillospiraceae bacterium]
MQIDYIELLINIALASFGGLVKRLSEIDKNIGMKITFWEYFTRSFISMFVGVVVYLLCKNFNVSQFLTASITALSGYAGIPVLELLSEIARKKIEKETGIVPENKNKN